MQLEIRNAVADEMFSLFLWRGKYKDDLSFGNFIITNNNEKDKKIDQIQPGKSRDGNGG